ncbi:MAG: hypothetical protein ACTHU0_22325 [Kofleriaceae bacterium]
MYVSVDDLRAEGVSVAMASSDRLRALIDEAGQLIDRVTGWWFESRTATLLMNGRGRATLETPVPPIRIDRLLIGRSEVELPDSVTLVGAPIQPGFEAPQLVLRGLRRFPRGVANVAATGRWGFTEPDGTPEGRTPLEIRRATLLLVLRWIDPLGGGASNDARNRWRILEERTRDQSYRLANPGTSDPLSGDPEVDQILARYRRPIGLGAA